MSPLSPVRSWGDGKHENTNCHLLLTPHPQRLDQSLLVPFLTSPLLRSDSFPRLLHPSYALFGMRRAPSQGEDGTTASCWVLPEVGITIPAMLRPDAADPERSCALGIQAAKA